MGEGGKGQVVEVGGGRVIEEEGGGEGRGLWHKGVVVGPWGPWGGPWGFRLLPGVTCHEGLTGGGECLDQLPI